MSITRRTALLASFAVVTGAAVPGVALAQSSPALAAVTTGTSKPVLQLGSRGAAVRDLQQFLHELLPTQPITGYYGTITRDNVKAYQAACGLRADGVVGPRTWAKIMGQNVPDIRPTLRLGDRGLYVRQLQASLRQFAPSLVVDGVFGPRTQTALKDLQRMEKFPVTGVCDRRVWEYLDGLGD